MKTKTPRFYLWSFILGLALSPMPLALSQIPQGFNYQAIARDGTGAVLQNTPLQVMFYVQSLQTGGTLFWKEWYSSVTTNSFGLFNLVVGNGVRQTESTVATFDLINWKVTPKYLKTEIYYSSAWHDLGTSQLMTVPYAMVAEDLAGSVTKLAVKGETSGLEEALFEVKNKDGQTVFAVYNEGVRVYVSDGAKAVKGGFAVGGFGTDKAESTKYLFVGKDSVRIYLDTNPLTKGLKSGFAVGGYDLTKGIVQNYLDVSSDSVRIYIDSNPATKKLKGGFAVGGYDMTKATNEEYLRVTRDSSRIYVNNNPGKGLKGGFAIGGFNPAKGPVSYFTSLTAENYFIGHEGGQYLTTGKYNSTVGYQSGLNITSGMNNAFMGYQEGLNNNIGTNNVFIGTQSGLNNTTGNCNVFIGFSAGQNNIGGDALKGSNNTFIGDYAGSTNTSGQENTFLGSSAGFAMLSGKRNTFLGDAAGYYQSTGIENTFIGASAGIANTSGNSNSFFGTYAGGNNSTGSGNVFIGYAAGYSLTGSNKLCIANSSTATPLIYGEFENQQLLFNGWVGIQSMYPYAALNVSTPTRQQIRSGDWSNMSGSGGGIGLFSTNSYLNYSDNTFRYSNTHANIGASGISFNAPWWNSVGIFVNNGPGNLDNSFSPSWIMTLTASTISLGWNTSSSGTYSTAMGSYVSPNGMQGAFIIGDRSTASLRYSSMTNYMTMYFDNGYSLFTNGTQNYGVYLHHNDNSWGTISDSTRKENFKPLDPEILLARFSQFRAGTWNYIGQEPDKYRHYGPMAQDFYNAFGHDGIGVIGNDTILASADVDGVAFVAIQALEKRTRELKEQISDLRAENAILRQEIEQIRAILSGTKD